MLSSTLLNLWEKVNVTAAVSCFSSFSLPLLIHLSSLPLPFSLSPPRSHYAAQADFKFKTLLLLPQMPGFHFLRLPFSGLKIKPRSLVHLGKFSPLSYISSSLHQT